MLKLLKIVCYVFLLTCISWIINGHSFIGIDDANIYMVYMRNLANGHGFRYNINGENVEGFTSLLWTLIGSFFYLFTSSPEKLLLIFNLLLSALCLYKVVNFIDNEKRKTSKLSLLFLGLIGVTPGFIDWTVLSLMDTGLFCCLFTMAVISTINYNAQLSIKKSHYTKIGILSILLVLCRPEAMLWVPLLIFVNFLTEYNSTKNLKRSISYLLIPLALYGLTLIIFFSWRLNYFGYPLPNTYYAKVSSDRMANLISGLLYLYSAAINKPFLLFTGIVALYTLINNVLIKKQIINKHITLSTFVIITFLIPLFSGGDHFGLQRFLMPSIPIIFLFLFTYITIYWNKLSRLILLFLLMFVSNKYNFIYNIIHKKSPISNEWSAAKYGRNISKKLNVFFKGVKLPSQGVLIAGGTAYSYKGKTIDLLALNNTKMAHANKVKNKNALKNHASFNKEIFYELSPDIFWYNDCRFQEINEYIFKINIDTTSFTSKVFLNIHKDEKFKEIYGLFSIKKLSSSKVLQIFAKKNFIDKLPTQYEIKRLMY